MTNKITVDIFHGTPTTYSTATVDIMLAHNTGSSRLGATDVYFPQAALNLSVKHEHTVLRDSLQLIRDLTAMMASVKQGFASLSEFANKECKCFPAVHEVVLKAKHELLKNKMKNRLRVEVLCLLEKLVTKYLLECCQYLGPTKGGLDLRAFYAKPTFVTVYAMKDPFLVMSPKLIEKVQSGDLIQEAEYARVWRVYLRCQNFLSLLETTLKTVKKPRRGAPRQEVKLHK